MEKTLASMRVGTDNVQIKNLAESSNKLLAKRAQKRAHEEVIVEAEIEKDAM